MVTPSDEPGWIESLREQVGLREFIQIAERLVAQHRYDEAIALFETALRLYPESLVLRLNLTRVQEAKRRRQQAQIEQVRADWEHHRRESDVVAQHFISLARTCVTRHYYLKALEFLELARHLNPSIAEIYRLEASIYVEQMDFERARTCIERVRALAPFDADAAAELAKIYERLRDEVKALESFIDAAVLAGQRDAHIREFSMRMIRSLAERRGLSPQEVEKRFAHRRAYYNQIVEQLVFKRDQVAFEVGPTDFDLMLIHWPRMQKHQRELLDRIVEVRHQMPFQMIDDEALWQIARQSEWIQIEAGQPVFPERGHPRVLWIWLQGMGRWQRSGSYGSVALAEVPAGSATGILEFLDGQPPIGQLVAVQESRLCSIPYTVLEEIVAGDRYLGIRLYWYFWKELSRQVRTVNHRLEDLFRKTLAADVKAPPDVPQRVRASAEVGPIDPRRRVPGLTSKELEILARFAQEERFRQGQVIFREGDPGDALYIVLEGRVRITRTIPGIGEEALAILDPGDFFGEMALVDQVPRSADAIAHSETTTVLAVRREGLTDLLSQDPDSAYRFLTILCRMLGRRLREAYDKLYHLHIIAAVSSRGTEP